MLLVCLGAPFGADGLSDPIWARGALAGPTGGSFIGFIAASYIMGRCAEAGHDRPRRVHRLVAWMLAAEAAIYACGLFWLPFGMAIKGGYNVSKVRAVALQLAEGSASAGSQLRLTEALVAPRLSRVVLSAIHPHVS